MEKLSYLVRKREGYLSLFNKVIRKLTSLNEKIVKEKDYINRLNTGFENAIKEANLKIEEGQNGLNFLSEQTDINAAQIEKIQSLIVPSVPEEAKDKVDE